MAEESTSLELAPSVHGVATVIPLLAMILIGLLFYALGRRTRQQ